MNAIAGKLEGVKAMTEFQGAPSPRPCPKLYRLNSVANGIVTVGCHRFEQAEILRFEAVLEAQK